MKVKITKTETTYSEDAVVFTKFHYLASAQPAEEYMATESETGIILFTYEGGNFTYIDGDFMKELLEFFGI